MDLALLQEIQEIEEKELEAKIKAEKKAESEMLARNTGRDLVNKANSIGNSERRKK